MKTYAALLILLSLTACHAPRLRPVDPAYAVALPIDGTHAPGSSRSTPYASHVSTLRKTTEALVHEWNQKLSHPETLPLVSDFDSEHDRALRKRARAPDFATSLGSGITQRQLVASAYERSPEILAAFLKLRASINKYSQVTALDAIQSQYASFQRSSMTKIGMPLSGDRMDQRFPFPGSIELKAALINHMVEEAQAKYAVAIQDVVLRARTLYARYVFVGRALAINRETLQYHEQLETTARSKFEAGVGSKSAVIQAQVERSKLKNDQITLEQDQHVVRAGIATLLDISPKQAIGPPTPSAFPTLEADVDALAALALKAQPKIHVADARVRRMTTMIALAEQTTYPAFSMGLSTMEGISHATGGSDKARQPFSTRPKGKPDPWFGSKEAYLREAREATQAAEAMAHRARNETHFDVRKAYADAETATRLYRLYRDVQIAQAEQATRDAVSAYEADRAGFLSVMDSLRRWLQFRLAADRAIRDTHIAHARLEAVTGGLQGGTAD